MCDFSTVRRTEMEDLIKVQVENDRQLVSARELHKGLGLKKKFSAWWEQNSKDFEEGTDFVRKPESYLTKSGNHGSLRAYDDYLLTIDMAKELCMMSKTEKGKEVRQYFIRVEKRFNEIKAMSIPKPDSYMIEDPIKRAERWIEEAKERQELEHKNEKLQAKIDKDADDVVFARAIRYSHHAIPIRELADILTQNGFTIGQNQLYKLLRDEKYLSKQKDFWNLPMSSKVKAGYFRVIHKVTRDGRPYRKTLVTPEGQKHLINKALKGKFDDNYQKVIVSTLGI